MLQSHEVKISVRLFINRLSKIFIYLFHYLFVHYFFFFFFLLLL